MGGGYIGAGVLKKRQHEAYPSGEEMKMNMWRRIELFCGIGCGVFGPLPFFLRHGAYAFELFRSSSGNLADALLLFFLPGLLVAVGLIFTP